MRLNDARWASLKTDLPIPGLWVIISLIPQKLSVYNLHMDVKISSAASKADKMSF